MQYSNLCRYTLENHHHALADAEACARIARETEDGQTQIDVRLENETVWLTQAQMAELFETDRTSIVRHINNIYRADELEREATCAKIAQVQKHLNTSLFCAESLCGKGVQGSEVFAKHLTLLLTLDLT